MPIGETLLGAVADAVFSYIIDTYGEQLTDSVRAKLGRNPTKTAFKKALNQAIAALEHHHPAWVASYFDASFFQNEGAPILAQFLIRDGHPSPSELAARWADSLSIKNQQRRTFYTRELEPVAAEFLDELGHTLKVQPALSALHDSRTLEQLVGEVQLIRQQLQAKQATPGTKRDYLRWLVARNSYIDIRGTMQTHRQVQLKLDQVYISLQGQPDILIEPYLNARSLLANTGYTMRREGGVEVAISPHGYKTPMRDFVSSLQREKAASGAFLSLEAFQLEPIVKYHSQLIILGHPGSGKTTLLRYLALQRAQTLLNNEEEAGTNLGAARFPILVRLADFAEENAWRRERLSDYLARDQELHECPAQGLPDLFQKELNQGNCLILLDGLDEIVNADDRRGIVACIDDFVRRYAELGNRFILTSRIAGYESAPLGEFFARYRIREMDEEQIHSFLHHWCLAVEDAQTPDLPLDERRKAAQREVDGIMKTVQSNPGVRRLASNPLLLRTLALIHRTGARLPQKRIKLYQLAADTLARIWRTAQGVPESALADETYLTRLLSELAYWMHSNKPSGLAHEQEVIAKLEQAWAKFKGLEWDDDQPDIEKEVKRFLRQVQVHTGLFVESDPKRYSFMHLTFEEYYAARYLVAQSKARVHRIRQHLHDPRWEEPILLALGLVSLDFPDDAAELMEAAILAEGEDAQVLGIVPSKYEEWLGRDFLFALRCLEDDIPVKPKLRQRLMERLVDELLHESGPAKFERYRKALEERLSLVREGETMVTPSLVAALRDPDIWVRSRAAECLGRIGNASAEVARALIDVLLQDAHAFVRQQAAHSLFRLGGPSPRTILPPEFSSLNVYTAWIDALGIDLSSFEQPKLTKEERESRVARLLDEQVATLQQSADAQVRTRAAHLLGSVGISAKDPWIIIHALIEALQQDGEAEVRAAAAESLGMGGGIGRRVPEVLDTLLEALRHDVDAEVRSSVIWSLEHLENTSIEVLNAVTAALQQDADWWVRSRAAECLGRLGKALPGVLNALTAALQQDAEIDVRSMAAWSLTQLEQGFLPRGDLILQGLKGARHPAIRSACARLLGEMGSSNEPTQQALWQGLLDTYGDVRKACVQALVELAQRFPATLASIEGKLVQALADSAFNQLDAPETDEPGSERFAYDYAYDALWSLVVGTAS